MKPSPGPWRVDGEGIKAMVRADDATIVCLRHRLPGVVNDANMRLIAAGPALLAVSEELTLLAANCWDRVDGALVLMPPNVERFDNAVRAAELAIANALGTKPPVEIE